MGISGLFRNLFQAENRDVCPQCGKNWDQSDKLMCTHCHYVEKVVICPQCTKIFSPEFLKDHSLINKLLHAPDFPDFFNEDISFCSCHVPYIRLDLDLNEYYNLHRNFEYNSISNNAHTVSKMAFDCVDRYIYENFFDDSQVDRDNPYFQKHYAHMFPETEESKAWFAKQGTTYEEKYYPTYYITEVLTFQEKEFTFPTPSGPVTLSLPPKMKAGGSSSSAIHVPKCPICGSTNLTKISNLAKGAKIAAFGIYGAGDVGKTWKCNNCGSKF